MKYKKIICVITHKGSANRLRAIKNTWLSKPLPKDHLLLFVYGNDGGSVPRIEGNNLFLAAAESWANLPNKMYDLYQFLIKNFDFEYLFKIDDDVYVESKLLIEYPKKHVDYAGRFSCPTVSTSEALRCTNYGVSQHSLTRSYEGSFPGRYAGGATYLLSRRAAEIVVSFSRESLEDCRLQIGYEDMMIGKCMEQFAIKNPESLHIDDWDESIFINFLYFKPVYSCDLDEKKIYTEHKRRFFRGVFHFGRKLKQFLKNKVLKFFL